MEFNYFFGSKFLYLVRYFWATVFVIVIEYFLQ